MKRYNTNKIIREVLCITLFPLSVTSVLADTSLQKEEQAILKKQDTLLNHTIKEVKDSLKNTDVVSFDSSQQTATSELENKLMEAIRNKDGNSLSKFLSIYKNTQNQDLSIIEWGTAIIAEEKNDLKTAIQLYRKINSALPNIRLLRFHMASALFKDKQYEAAQFEFEKLRSEESLSEIDKMVLTSYLEEISKVDQWFFDSGISYVYDPNINNSPNKGTTLNTDVGSFSSSSEPETASGLSYSLGIGKKWSKNNYYISPYLSLNGSYYWDNHKQNNLTSELTIGLGYNDAKKGLELAPFFSNNLSVNKDKSTSRLDQYMKNYGSTINGYYWINEKLKYNSSLTISRNEYIDTYKHLNGNQYSLDNSLFYLPNQKTYFFGGINYSLKNARDADDEYKRVSTRIGWGQTWGIGLSTQWSLSYGVKSFKGTDFLNIKRKDKEYGSNFSIWHRNIHFMGITPKLTWNYRKVDGNHPFYNYDKSNIYINLSKTF